jgi:hypothetical protein
METQSTSLKGTNNMKTTVRNILLTSTLALGALAVVAQETDEPRGPGGGPGGMRQGPPILQALDTNKDGKLDATEIANASKALKTLDKNGDGELTQDEIGGPRRGGERGGPGGGPERRPPPSE